MIRPLQISTLLLLLQCLMIKTAVAQKKVSELAITYNYSVGSESDAKPGSTAITATNIFYVKGNMSRSEMINSQFSSTTIYDAKSGGAVILKEVNGQKLLIRLTPEDWQERNNRYKDIQFAKTNDHKNIAGYEAYRATASTKDGFNISVYYTKDLIPDNKEYDATFRNLDGLPLEYEFTKGKLHIRYSLASINLNSVPASKFDIPTSGYRELTYDESRKLNLNN